MARKFTTGIDLTGQKIINSANGTTSTDLVTYGQVQNLLNGLDWHLHARACATSNITISAPGATIDGVTLALGDRVLLTAQTTTSQNLIYIWNGASAAMTVAPDSVQGEIDATTTLSISEGTTQAGKSYTLITANPITVGTTALSWAQNNAGTAYTAGNGLLLSSSAFSVDTSKVVLKYATTIGDGTTTSFTITHGLGSIDAIIQIFDATSGVLVEADMGVRTTNTIPVTFGTAPTTNQYRVVVKV